MPGDLLRGLVLAVWTLSAVADLAAQTTRPDPRAVRPIPSRPEASRAEDEEANAEVARALDRAIGSGWRELRIEAECRTEDGFPSVKLFGNGIGIWSGAAQFRLPAASLTSLLEALRDGGFARLRPSYGGKGDPLLPVNQAPRVSCRIGLEIDGMRKHVAQLQGGRQSDALAGMARRILDECRAPGAAGVLAASLNEGLQKLASGTLAPEAFGLVVNRSGQDSAAGGESWLLRVDGRWASVDRRAGDLARDAKTGLELGDDELGRLARQLVDAGINELPPNLYAEQYTDVTVIVLNRRKQIQARRFDGLTPTTHGEKQRRFDRLLEQLEALQQGVSGAGRAGSAATP